MKHSAPNRLLYLASSILQILIGGSALFGGYNLLTIPDGSSLDMPLSLLAESPFTDYYVPGLLLFIGIGLFHIGGAVVSWVRFRYAGQCAFILGFILLFWIIIQIAMIGYASLLQPIYFILGLAEIDLGIRWMKTSSSSIKMQQT